MGYGRPAEAARPGTCGLDLSLHRGGCGNVAATWHRVTDKRYSGLIAP
jgi:hypothetical protein